MGRLVCTFLDWENELMEAHRRELYRNLYDDEYTWLGEDEDEEDQPHHLQAD